MRFKTKLRVDKVQHMLRYMQVLEKVNKDCVLHLTAITEPDIRFILPSDLLGSNACFLNFRKSAWFQNYRIESVNENQIGLQLDARNFSRALRSASVANEVLIKLTKKGVPVLNFEIKTAIGSIVQDIPVSVLSPVRLAEMVEPDTEPELGVTLPSITKMHSVVDKMKAVATQIELHATIFERAALSIQLNNESVEISSTYKGLYRASMDGSDVVPDQEVKRCAVVDARNLSKALYGHQISPKQAFCYISYYVPVLIT